MAVYAANQDESLDALVWRTTGGGPAALEAVLAANPGLAAIAAALPEGTPVTIPDTAPAQDERALVNLWD
ncbi:tail protein X [Flavisphingomonas formosensis]|uniref:tail protein X n=1 Tax=Flavisphingomonas formosensis TaxID=861534 RepID=UPI0012FC542C|nr:tail protein X [Sphingomonas formosensis]